MTLLIRADASAEIGTGHVMRCIALAEAWTTRGGRVTFLSHCGSSVIRDRVVHGGAAIVQLPATHPDPADWRTTSQLVRELRPDWLVIDSYHLGPEYQKAARTAGSRVLVVDDAAHWPEYHADLLLNQNVGAEDKTYRCDPDTKLLLGTRYALLRAEFLRRPRHHREVRAAATNVLIAMGGTDPCKATPLMVRLVGALDTTPLHIRVVASAIGSTDELRESARGSKHAVEIVGFTDGVAELMAWSDLAVVTAGGVIWELLFVRTPVVAFTTSDRFQRGTVEALAQRNAVFDAGNVRDFDESRFATSLSRLIEDRATRMRMVDAGGALVDGGGVERVLESMGTRPRERRPAVVSAAPRNRVEQRTREEHLCVAIRRVRPGEKAEFEKMAIRHFKELDGSFVPTQRWLDGFFRVSALGEPSHAWWATVDGKKVGFVVLTVSSHLYLPIRTGRVEELYVIPEFRRQGVGRMLFRYAATVLKRAGSVRIDLTVLDDNSPARQFWTAQGFRRRAEDYRLEIREAK